MVLDINLFRVDKGGNPDLVRESQRRRGADVGAVDAVIALDEAWRAARFKSDGHRKVLNQLSREVGECKKAKDEAGAAAKMAEVAERKQMMADDEVAVAAAWAKLQEVQGTIGNLVHERVPVSMDEAENRVERSFGLESRRNVQGVSEEKLWNHVDLMYMAGISETVRGSAAAGNRGYYLTGAGVLLNQALISYALGFLVSRQFTPIQTPFFLKKDVMAECAQLDSFDDELYKVSGEGDDKYLIATSEQSICCYHRGERLSGTELPLRYAGYSTCFRKEVGSHGRDTLGIFRVHQFEKVEQFCVCRPGEEDSWAMLEEMIGNSEDFYKSLGLPFQVVNIVSGALNNAAAMKYDLEAWFPAARTFRELVSTSNCTDYQSRNLDVRFAQTGPKAAEAGAPSTQFNNSQNEYVHMLNATMTATERTLCCIVENYQTPDGIRVPDVLKPYMMGREFIPFLRPDPSTKEGKKFKVPLAAPGVPPIAEGASAAAAAPAPSPSSSTGQVSGPALDKLDDLERRMAAMSSKLDDVLQL